MGGLKCSDLTDVENTEQVICSSGNNRSVMQAETNKKTRRAAGKKNTEAATRPDLLLENKPKPLHIVLFIYFLKMKDKQKDESCRATEERAGDT